MPSLVVHMNMHGRGNDLTCKFKNEKEGMVKWIIENMKLGLNLMDLVFHGLNRPLDVLHLDTARSTNDQKNKSISTIYHAENGNYLHIKRPLFDIFTALFLSGIATRLVNNLQVIQLWLRG